MRTRKAVALMRTAILSSRARTMPYSTNAGGQGFWNSIAYRQHQPAHRGVQYETSD
jgi:hypothetical protein